jgi:hypothetical protein
MGNLMSWQWYEWETLADFETWHESVKTELGLPKLSVDRNGNECQPMVENYTRAIETEGKAIAMVEDKLAIHLTITNLRPPKVENDIIS